MVWKTGVKRVNISSNVLYLIAPSYLIVIDNATFHRSQFINEIMALTGC